MRGISYHPFNWNLEALAKCDYIRTGDSPLKKSARATRYPFRALRYWHAACAIVDEARRLGRPPTIVDMGCKRGTLKQITPEIPGAKWIGLDIRIEHKGLVASHYDEVHASDFDLPLPLADNSADIAVCLHVFEHLHNLDFTLSEVRRVLRPCGILVVGTPVLPSWLARIREAQFRREFAEGKRLKGKHIHAFSPSIWRKILQNAGYEIDFLFGSHLYRQSGSPLENQRWWVRANQAWGVAFPALGRDIIIQARTKG